MLSLFKEVLPQLILASFVPLLLLILRTYYDRILAFREELDYDYKSYFDQDAYILNVKLKRSLLSAEFIFFLTIPLIGYVFNPILALVFIAIAISFLGSLAAIVSFFFYLEALYQKFYAFLYERFKAVALSDIKRKMNLPSYEVFEE